MKNLYFNYDSSLDAITEVYKESFDLFLKFKTELEKYENSLLNFKNTHNLYTMNILPSENSTVPKIGNALMPILSCSSCDKESMEEISQLYNGDACQVLLEEKEFYDKCTKFWSSIITKGIEQSIVQMSVTISSAIDELNSVNKGTKNFNTLLENESSFIIYEVFVEFYLFMAFMKTMDKFNIFIENQKRYILSMTALMLIVYGVVFMILYFLFGFFIFRYKYAYNSFLYFIGILPVKFLAEDTIFYKNVIKLEQDFY